MSARPVDGAAGYRFYLQHDGNVQLEEINEFLRGLDLREVKPRMLRHYQKLRRHGYRSYITQNRLDLAVAGEPGWLEELQARYAEISQAVPIEVEWLPNNLARGNSDAIGLASATAFLDAIPPAGTPVVFRLSESRIEKVATVVRTDASSGRVHFRFDAYGSLPIAPSTARYRVQLRTTVPERAESFPSLADLMLKIERAFSLTQPNATELPRVSSMSMTSPFDVTLLASNPWLGAVALALAMPVLRRQWHEGTLKKQEGLLKALELEEKNPVLAELTMIESDEQLRKELDKALLDPDGEAAEVLIQDLHDNGGGPAVTSLSRRELFVAARAFLLLPVDLTVEGSEADTRES